MMATIFFFVMQIWLNFTVFNGRIARFEYLKLLSPLGTLSSEFVDRSSRFINDAFIVFVMQIW